MHHPPNAADAGPTDLPAAPRTPTEALLHRWLVEYNPLYLLSAALVLAGMWLISREAAQVPTLAGALGVGALAELYAVALVAGAAFLARIGQRRSAVMLGLIAVFYQGDVTLHVETCTYLGAAGLASSSAWLALFVGKLVGLAWALQLGPSRSACVAPLLGGLGLAFVPHALRELEPGARSLLVAGWTFTLFASALWTERRVSSGVGWDVRGRRAMRATWLVWGGLTLCHVLYWSPTYRVSLLPLLPVVFLLGVPFMRHEVHVHGLALSALGVGYLAAPQHLWLTATLCGVTLAVGAWRGAVVIPRPAPLEARHPYRTLASPHAAAQEVPAPLGVPDEAARARLLLAALGFFYLGVWVPDASLGDLPLHALGPVLAAMALGVALAWRTRRPGLATPLLPLGAHALAQRDCLPLPDGALEWGIAATTAGFAVLFGALAASWYVGRCQLARDALRR